MYKRKGPVNIKNVTDRAIKVFVKEEALVSRVVTCTDWPMESLDLMFLVEANTALTRTMLDTTSRLNGATEATTRSIHEKILLLKYEYSSLTAPQWHVHDELLHDGTTMDTSNTM